MKLTCTPEMSIHNIRIFWIAVISFALLMKRDSVVLTSVTKRPTARVTGAGAGVDSAWEQKKLEARKMLVNRADSPASSAPAKIARSFYTRERHLV